MTLPRYSTREIVMDSTGSAINLTLDPRKLGHNPSWIKAADVDAELARLRAENQRLRERVEALTAERDRALQERDVQCEANIRLMAENGEKEETIGHYMREYQRLAARPGERT